MKKICVTGATGFLGAYVVKLFLDKGDQVIALGRRHQEGLRLEKEGARFLVGDLRSRLDVERAIKGCDYVVHAGALSSAWGEYERFYKTNVVGTKNVIYACKKYRIKRLVFISSPSIYTEKRDRLSIKEDEVNVHNQLNTYIYTKLLGEKVIRENSDDVEWVILRPRGLFGIGDTSLIPRLLRAHDKVGIPLFKQGRNKVDITYVENVAWAVYLAVNKENISGSTYNITNGEPMAFKELLTLFLDKIGEKPRFLKIKFDWIYPLVAGYEKVCKCLSISREPIFTRYTLITLGFSQTLDISAARKDLGYKPIYTLREGIEKYAKWYKKNYNNKKL